MHPYLLVPLCSAIGAAVLASAIAGREPDRRANRLTSALLLCAGVWSLFELVWNMAPDAELAATAMRWGNVGSLLLGPLVLHLLVTTAGEFRRFRPLVPPCYALAFAALVGAVATDWVVQGARRTAWGWAAIPGPGLAAVYATVTLLPLGAGLTWLVGHLRSPRWRRPALPGVVWAGAACFAVAIPAQVLALELGFETPPVGAASVVAWGAVAWRSIYRFREPRLAPARFAREILETLPDGVALLRPDGRIRFSNDRLGQLAERPCADLLGLHVTELLIEGCREEGSVEDERECELVTTSDRRIPVSVTHGPLQDESGHTVGHVLSIHDLREVVELRSRLVASGRLVAIGQLAAGIAHEINNPISYVRSNLSLLGEHWQKTDRAFERTAGAPLVRAALDEGPELLREAAEGIDRVAAIVRDVGSFARGGLVEKETASLAELVDTASRVAAPQLKHVSVAREVHELPPVSCVPQELIQVFLNLMLNAAQACGRGGAIHVAARAVGDEAWIEVSDDGPGIPPEVRERIFEPFFTTKPVGEGTGLGLSIAQQIAAQHGGEIEVDSEPGLGTTFRVRLPLGGEAGTVGAEGA